MPERLAHLGAINVVRASDCLLVGPSRRDPRKHEQAREVWWDTSEKWDHLYSPAVRWDRPVVLWVSANIGERIHLWRACSWLRRMRIPARDIFPLELDVVPPRRPPEEPTPPFNCTASVADHSDEVLLERLAGARPWRRERHERAARLWSRFAGDNPIPFVRSCLRGVGGFPELGPLWTFLSCFFPREKPGGGLRLSRFDEIVLSILSGEWQTPVAMFVHKSDAGVALRQLLSGAGDLFLPRRLDEWVNHGPSAAVERAPGPRPDLPMKSFVYRITEAGARLRERGLADLADAPALPVAGTAAYAPSAPWVVLEDGRLVECEVPSRMR